MSVASEEYEDVLNAFRMHISSEPVFPVAAIMAIKNAKNEVMVRFNWTGYSKQPQQPGQEQSDHVAEFIEAHSA